MILQIPPECLQTAAALGVRNEPGEAATGGEPMEIVATGFLYTLPTSGDPSDRSSEVRMWLVTCKHVIEGVRDAGMNELLVRLNRSAGQGMTRFSTSLQPNARPGWTLHPAEDVAVILASGEDLNAKQIDWRAIPATRNALTKDEAIALEFYEGDEVFTVGFPVGWRKGRQDWPIVRQGILAQVQGWFNGDHDTFLVDGSGFPGNSGGPLFTKPRIESIPESRIRNSYLLGMVSEVRVSPISSSPIISEPADLIDVVPMDIINDTISIAMQNEVDSR